LIKCSLITYLTSPEITMSCSNNSKQNTATESDSGMNYKSLTGF